MGKETRLFKSEEKKTLNEVSAFLREIAERMNSGQIILRQGQDEITLTLPSNLILEIEVEDEDKGRSGVQHSLEIEIKWFDSDDAGGPVELG